MGYVVILVLAILTVAYFTKGWGKVNEVFSRD